MVVRIRFVPSLIFSLGLFDRFTLPEQDPNSRVGHFLTYANGRAYCDRLDRLIEWSDHAGECDMGSGGASLKQKGNSPG
jgi:hypothetical protein